MTCFMYIRVRVAEVEVHETNKEASHQNASHTLADLGQIIVAMCRCHKFTRVLRLPSHTHKHVSKRVIETKCRTYHGVFGIHILEHSQIILSLDLIALLDKTNAYYART